MPLTVATGLVRLNDPLAVPVLSVPLVAVGGFTVIVKDPVGIAVATPEAILTIWLLPMLPQVIVDPLTVYPLQLPAALYKPWPVPQIGLIPHDP